MKKLILLFVLCVFVPNLKLNAQLLPGYNSMYYSDVFKAAEGVGQPFLLMQGVLSMGGVTVIQDSLLRYNGKIYRVHSEYQNPVSGNTNHYYIESASYPAYQIGTLAQVWPEKIPNVLYNYGDSTFNSLADCVGYGTRLLSATGDETTAGNSYLNLISVIKQGNTTTFASPGWVASAYEFGAAFATLPNVNNDGWGYVAGNILADSINAYNHRSDPSLLPYNGVVKSGYSSAMHGDILAFSYKPGGASNGHFMVISGQPYQIGYDTVHKYYPNVSAGEINTFLSTYHVWATPVYDCSGKNAHFNDSRIFMSGIGHGTLWVLTTPSNETPIGYIFEPPATSTTSINPYILGPTHLWAITVGRYKNGGLGFKDPEKGKENVPVLQQNNPNPVKESTNISFTIPSAGKTSLKVFDISGLQVANLIDDDLFAGSYSFKLTITDLQAGIYQYVLIWKNQSIVKQLIVIK